MVQLLLLLAVAAVIGYVQYRMGLMRMAQELEAKSHPLEDPKLLAAIRRLALANGLGHVQAQVFDMPMVNGLATPDGRVFVTTALMQKYKIGLLSAEEVASVVAHELGHVALGHHRRRMIDWTGRSAAQLALGVVLNRFLPIIGFYIAALLGAFVAAGLSRRDEFEADRYATALMIRAGFGAGPQIAMLRKLGRMIPNPQGASWLASHPAVDERVAEIEHNAAAWAA
ncbi:MAG: peptidase M48 [Rhodobacteraceae bacterium]|nr:MAG: peptidase M48 [Paracoccaceae bacterium]